MILEKKEIIIDNISHRFRMIHNRIDRYFNFCQTGLEKLKLTHSQCAVMFYLYDHRDEDIFQKDIEAAFHISAATTSNTLKGLEKQNVIERTAIVGDARKKKISLTKMGKEVHEAALSNIEQTEATVTRGMTEEEIATLKTLLDKVIWNFDNPDFHK